MDAQGLSEIDQAITLTGYAMTGLMAMDAMVDTVMFSACRKGAL